MPTHKRCPKCGRTKKSPEEFGWTYRKLRSGEKVPVPRSWCKTCQREKVRKWRDKERRAGRLKQRQKKWNRDRKRRAREREHRDELDPKPIIEWIDGHPMPARELAQKAGIDESTIRKWRKGHKASLESVDKLLTAWDAQDQLNVLYPL